MRCSCPTSILSVSDRGHTQTGRIRGFDDLSRTNATPIAGSHSGPRAGLPVTRCSRMLQVAQAGQGSFHGINKQLLTVLECFYYVEEDDRMMMKKMACSRFAAASRRSLLVHLRCTSTAILSGRWVLPLTKGPRELFAALLCFVIRRDVRRMQAIMPLGKTPACRVCSH